MENHWIVNLITSKTSEEVFNTSAFYGLPTKGCQEVRGYCAGRHKALLAHHVGDPYENDGKRYIYWLDVQAKESSDLFLEVRITEWNA